jgi:hypothetical protein
MKRFTPLVLIAFLITLNPAPIAYAVVKAGAACTKAGTTSTVSGVKYSCVKIGKKLVWSKGVAVVKKPTPAQTPAVLPTATPTPTPSATPTVAPTPIPQPTQTARPINQLFWKFKVENNILYRNVEANGSWLTTDSRKNDEFDLIRLKAWQEIKSIAIPSERQKSVTYFVGPNVDPAVENAYRFLIEK